MHLKMLVAHGNAVPFKALTHKLVERKMHAPVVGALAPHTQGILHVACVVGADPDERRRVFQDPMTGTTATMQIDENLALAARRGKRRGLSWGITKKEKEYFHELLKELFSLFLKFRISVTSKVTELMPQVLDMMI